MPDEETQGVDTEVALPQETETEQTDQTVEQQSAQDPPQRRESDQEYNWRETRRRLEDLQRRNEELEAKFDRATRSQPQPEDELAKLADDDIITAKQARKLAEREAQRLARFEAEKVIKEREAATVNDRITTRYPDFDDVVSPENVEILRTQEPELFASLQRLADDPYAQATGAYKLIRKLGIGDSPDVAKNKVKALENSRKPVSAQSVAKQSSAIADVHRFDGGLTPELRKQLQKEMEEAAKRL